MERSGQATLVLPNTAPRATVPPSETKCWWAGKRLRFNGLVAAGAFMGGTGYVVIANLRRDLEITPFTLGAQAVGLLVYICLANVAYSLGPLIERTVTTRFRSRYRRAAFYAGTVLTMLPLLCIPLILLLQGPSSS